MVQQRESRQSYKIMHTFPNLLQPEFNNKLNIVVIRCCAFSGKTTNVT